MWKWLPYNWQSRILFNSESCVLPLPPRRPQGEGTDTGSSQSRPSLRDLHSPQAMCKSTVEEDLKKLIVPEIPSSSKHKEKKVRHQLKSAVILSECAAIFECSFTREQLMKSFFLAVLLLRSSKLRAPFSAAHPVRWEYIPGSAAAVSGRFHSGSGSGQRRALQLLYPATIANHPWRPTAQTFLQNGHQDAW